MFPVIRVPISRKLVFGFITAGIAAVLQTVGVVETSSELAAWLSTGVGFATAFVVPEGVKFLDYAAERLGLKVVDFEDAP